MLHNLEAKILQSQIKRRYIEFAENISHPYLQSVIDHVNGRMESTELISFLSVFDPRHLPDKQKELFIKEGI